MNTSKLKMTPSNEINILHNIIKHKLRSSVIEALKIGKLLIKQKENIKHGEFEKWIEHSLTFSTRSAERYMKLYRYRGKTDSLTDLQSAYKMVQSLDAKKRTIETKLAFDRVLEYKKTGKKPENWRQNTDDKLFKEEIERDERINNIKENYEQRIYEQKHIKDPIKKAINEFNEDYKIRKEYKDKLKLSGDIKETYAYLDAIMDYLNGLEDDNRRLEACHNIIKTVKSITKDLQRKIYQNT